MSFAGRVLNRFNRGLILLRGLLISHRFKCCGGKVTFQSIDFLHGAGRISLGSNISFGKGLSLAAWKFGDMAAEVKIGNGCNIGNYNHITASGRVVIGNGVLTGMWVTITDNSHGRTDIGSLTTPPAEREVLFCGDVLIEDDVWIGDKATILPGVVVGKGCVVGANSVVTKSVPPYSVVVGNPARVVGKR